MNTACLTFLLMALGADATNYSQDVAPILERRCAGCHNASDREAEFSVESIETMLRGGKHGAALTPGQLASSRMWLMMTGRLEPRMPPEDEDPLTLDELAVVTLWIEAGAIDPAGAMPLRRQLRVPKIDVDTEVSLPITAVAISPDGTMIAESRHNQIRIKPRDSASQVGSLAFLIDGKVTKLEFSSTGELLAAASGTPGVYGQATVVKTSDGTVMQELIGHRDLVYDAVFSPDGKRLATAGYDRMIQIWNIETGKSEMTCLGHNGAIYDLDFSRDGTVLASASADNTIKLWNTSTGERLDTLGQPQHEVLSVTFSPDDRWIVAGSSDNRFRVWRFTSRNQATINPLVETRFADESPLTCVRFTRDGKQLVVVSESGNVKLFDTESWSQQAVLEPLSDVATAVASADPVHLTIAQMNGKLAEYELAKSSNNSTPPHEELVESIEAIPQQALAVDPGQLPSIAELEPNSEWSTAQSIAAPALISGVIGDASRQIDEDWFRFTSKAGEQWLLEVKASRDKSPLDSVIEVRTAKGEPIERMRLQAVRDSYFTFRGKDSDTSDDFRMFAWQEMELNDYLYANGEVVRFWLYPRGPDSGFKVYPGAGKRWTFFDTSPLTHSLAEPAYIVRPLPAGNEPLANGLPVFSIKHVNDDDPLRRWGSDSRLQFTAPETGEFLIRVRDARDAGGPDYKYSLTLRAIRPSYTIRLNAFDKSLPRGAGREFSVTVQREDGFDSAVAVYIEGLPRGIHATSPVVIEAGQETSEGIIYADADAPIPSKPFTPTSIARSIDDNSNAFIEVSGWKPIEVSERPKVQVIIEPVEDDGELTSVDQSLLAGADSTAIALPTEGPLATSPWTLRLKPGDTAAARFVVLRDNFENLVQFGKEDAGRSLPFAVFVDNIGLNGLMVPAGASRRTFFITAAAVATPQRRLFYLKSDVDGGITSAPIVLALE